MSDKNPTIYSARPWQFNTGDVRRGNQGLIVVPAGASSVLTAADLEHPYAKHHASKSPIPGVGAGGVAGSEDYAALQARYDSVDAERRQAVTQAANMREELDALRSAVAMTATDRERELENQVKAASAELQGVRAQLAKAQADRDAALGKK